MFSPEDTEYQSKVAGLNDTQCAALEHVVQFTCARHQYFMGEQDTLPEPLYLFLTGGAGTGKSHVISVIKEHIERAHMESQNSCMLVLQPLTLVVSLYIVHFASL